MRLLGFDPAALRLAGFSDIDVLTAGYTAAELREANFTAEELRRVGLADGSLRVAGYQTEQQVRNNRGIAMPVSVDGRLPCIAPCLAQVAALSALFESTRGDRWKDSSGWRAFLLQPPSAAAAAMKRQPCSGVGLDRATHEIIKLHLCANNLSGK